MRNGSGTYSLPVNGWNPATNGVAASAADWQTLINDVATALTASLSADGQTPMTGNLVMGSNMLTGLSAGANAGDSVRFEQLPSASNLLPVASGGTGSANAANARTALSAAASGANADITSLTALSAGGLPNSSVLTADIADAQITAPKLDGAQSGSAPIFAARAWGRFDGATGALLASGNITSVVRNSVGNYTVTIATDLADANGGIIATAVYSSACITTSSNITAGTFSVFSFTHLNALVDPASIAFWVVR